MPRIPLHLPSQGRSQSRSTDVNPLPQLLQTPSGLALLEIQGTVNLPAPGSSSAPGSTPLGRLVFPNYSTSHLPENTYWMKPVYFYVGQHQRLTGEVRKLTNPMAVIRRRISETEIEEPIDHQELEIAEIVYYKIIFSSRPEPISELI